MNTNIISAILVFFTACMVQSQLLRAGLFGNRGLLGSRANILNLLRLNNRGLGVNRGARRRQCNRLASQQGVGANNFVNGVSQRNLDVASSRNEANRIALSFENESVRNENNQLSFNDGTRINAGQQFQGFNNLGVANDLDAEGFNQGTAFADNGLQFEGLNQNAFGVDNNLGGGLFTGGGVLFKRRR